MTELIIVVVFVAGTTFSLIWLLWQLYVPLFIQLYYQTRYRIGAWKYHRVRTRAFREQLATAEQTVAAWQEEAGQQ